MPALNIHTGHVLGGAILLAPAAGILAPVLLIPLAAFALIGVLIVRWSEQGSGTRVDRSLIAIVGMILIWSVLSLLWTAGGEGTVAKFLSFAAFTVLAAATLIFCPILVEHERHALRRFILTGIALGFALYFLDLAAAGTINKHGSGTAQNDTHAPLTSTPFAIVLLLFIWPAISFFWRSSPPVALTILGVGVVYAFTIPGAIAITAIMIGAVFFFASLLAARGAATFLAIAVSAAILLAPFIPRIAPALDPGSIRQATAQDNVAVRHRLQVWHTAIGSIETKPLTGWGFNASPAVLPAQTNKVSENPQSGALQIWLDLGLPGAIGFAALFGLAILRTAHQSEPASTAAALGAIATAAPIWLLCFDVWQISWIAVLVITAMLTVALAEPNRG